MGAGANRDDAGGDETAGDVCARGECTGTSEGAGVPRLDGGGLGEATLRASALGVAPPAFCACLFFNYTIPQFPG